MSYNNAYTFDKGHEPFAVWMYHNHGHAVGAVMKMVKAARKIYGYHKTVQELNKLDDHVLKDIGIERSGIPTVAARMAGKVHK